MQRCFVTKGLPAFYLDYTLTIFYSTETFKENHWFQTGGRLDSQQKPGPNDVTWQPGCTGSPPRSPALRSRFCSLRARALHSPLRERSPQRAHPAPSESRRASRSPRPAAARPPDPGPEGTGRELCEENAGRPPAHTPALSPGSVAARRRRRRRSGASAEVAAAGGGDNVK